MGPKYSILHKAFCEMAKICKLKRNLKQIISQFFIKNPTWRPSTLEPESYKDTMQTGDGYSEENMVLTIKEGNLQSFQTETYQDNASRFQKDIKIMEVVGDRHTTKLPIKPIQALT